MSCRGIRAGARRRAALPRSRRLLTERNASLAPLASVPTRSWPISAAVQVAGGPPGAMSSADWRATMQGLLLDTESNLRRVRRATNSSSEGSVTPTKKVRRRRNRRRRRQARDETAAGCTHLLARACPS